jgi:hypothetical protein
LRLQYFIFLWTIHTFTNIVFHFSSLIWLYIYMPIYNFNFNFQEHHDFHCVETTFIRVFGMGKWLELDAAPESKW